jgi:hypothetical protein
LKNTDVFIDLEGLGISFDLRVSIAMTKFIAHKLPLALEKEGYLISNVAAFACYKRTMGMVPPSMQKSLRKAFALHRWTMIWSDCIADTTLIRAVDTGLSSGKLAESVMVITNDHDFIGLLDRIGTSGRESLVCGPSMSRKLLKHAHRSFHLWKLLGETFKIDPREYEAMIPPMNTPFNDLVLPGL